MIHCLRKYLRYRRIVAHLHLQCAVGEYTYIAAKEHGVSERILLFYYSRFKMAMNRYYRISGKEYKLISK